MTTRQFLILIMIIFLGCNSSSEEQFEFVHPETGFCINFPVEYYIDSVDIGIIAIGADIKADSLVLGGVFIHRNHISDESNNEKFLRQEFERRMNMEIGERNYKLLDSSLVRINNFPAFTFLAEFEDSSTLIEFKMVNLMESGVYVATEEYLIYVYGIYSSSYVLAKKQISRFINSIEFKG